jgi:putative addiction module component (TIGR02574 family)
MVNADLISKVKTLSATERLELLGIVWDTLTPIDTPITDDEKQILDARLEDFEANPADQSSWPEVQARLQRLLP